MNQLVVRQSKIEDARGILEAHYSAVHETASKDYPFDVISEWSTPVDQERIQKYVTESFPQETTLVAEVNGEIAGFGSIVENELRAVYVSAKHARRGVGSALLTDLEKVARSKRCTELHMHSSITAEPFYRRHGFRELERGFHTLRSGKKMACVMMSKEFKSQDLEAFAVNRETTKQNK